jgi:hypothetical protein
MLRSSHLTNLRNVKIDETASKSDTLKTNSSVALFTLYEARHQNNLRQAAASAVLERVTKGFEASRYKLHQARIEGQHIVSRIRERIS